LNNTVIVQVASEISLRVNLTLRYMLFLSLLLLMACGGSKKANTGRFTKETDPHLQKSGKQVRENPDLRIKIDFYYVEAATQAGLGNYQEALSLYKEVLKLDPGNHAAMYEIARLYLELKRPSEAVEYGQKARQLHASNYWYHFITAEAYNQLNKISETEKILLKMTELFPTDKDIKIELADLYLRSQQFDKALKIMDQLEHTEGMSTEIRLQKFRIYANQRKHKEATREIRLLIQQDPSNTDYYRYLHDYFVAIDSRDSAISVLEELIVADPSNTFGLITLSQYYRNQGRTTEANQLQTRAMQSEGLTPEGKVQLLLALSASLNQDSSLYENILQITNELLEVQPENNLLMALKADLFRFKNELDSARIWLLKSLSKEGVNESLWENLLYLDAGLERYDLLFEDSNKALEYFPNNQSILFMNGISAYFQKNYEEARFSLEKALKQPIHNSEQEIQILSTLGEVCHYLGDYAQSDIYFERVLSKDQENATLLNNYAYYLSVRNVQLDKAEKMVLKALDLMPGTASFEDTYGWILYQKGNYPEALIWIQLAMDKSPSPDVADHLGDVHFRLGNMEKAIEYWKKARDLGLEGSVIESKIRNGKL